MHILIGKRRCTSIYEASNKLRAGLESCLPSVCSNSLASKSGYKQYPCESGGIQYSIVLYSIYIYKYHVIYYDIVFHIGYISYYNIIPKNAILYSMIL